MRRFRELMLGESVFIVEVDDINQKVNMYGKIVEKHSDNGIIEFTDGTTLTCTDSDYDGDIVNRPNRVFYFTNPAMAKRQMRIEYNRMIDMTRLLIKKFEKELEQWDKNMKVDGCSL